MGTVRLLLVIGFVGWLRRATLALRPGPGAGRGASVVADPARSVARRFADVGTTSRPGASCKQAG